MCPESETVVNNHACFLLLSRPSGERGRCRSLWGARVNARPCRSMTRTTTAMKKRSTSHGVDGADPAPTAGAGPRAGGAAGVTGWAGGGTETESAAAPERGVCPHARTATLCPPTSPHAQPRSPSSSPAKMKVNMAASTLLTSVVQSLCLYQF